MTPVFEDRFLLELRFKASQPVSGLGHFHGIKWNAMIRELLKDYVSDRPMAELEIHIQPMDTGLLSFSPGDSLHLGLSFPARLKNNVMDLLLRFNTLTRKSGAIRPGVLSLQNVLCRVSGVIINFPSSISPVSPDPEGLNHIRPLTPKDLKHDIATLASLNRFSVHFFTPARIKNPEDKRPTRYLNPEFFQNPENTGLFLSLLGCPERSDGPVVTSSTLLWTDSSYKTKNATYGGILGTITFEGVCSQEEAERIVTCGYLGMGKNRTFGLGFFRIPEIEAGTLIRPLSRGTHLLSQITALETLSSSLSLLPDSSPGPDGMTVPDLKKAGRPYLRHLSESLEKGSFHQGDIRICRIEKSRGYRELCLFNTGARLVHRAISDVLSPVVHGFLSDAAWAYRKGLNRKGAAQALVTAMKQGQTFGLKADISSFFNSVNIRRIVALVRALLPLDPCTDLIEAILFDCESRNIEGLPQGSPLSPVLSNLYLDDFDKSLKNLGFTLVRYGDDFVALTDRETSETDLTACVEQRLSRIGLCLNREKSIVISKDTPFTFLGYEIVNTKAREQEKEDEENGENTWNPVFRDDWYSGRPVYLTSLCRGAYSSGPSLVVRFEGPGDSEETRDIKEEIGWNRISRLIVVGRASFSGGVVYRAVREGIPVTFIDVKGRTTGHLLPDAHDMFSFERLQDEKRADPQFSLEFSKALIQCKIRNHKVVLKRNRLSHEPLYPLLDGVKNAENLDSLRGYEGSAARHYFGQLKTCVAPFIFEKRVYHPPDCPVNAMLSFGYTLLYNRLASVLRDKGFNPAKGFFHVNRGNHMALSSDLLETLRHVADRIVLGLIHKHQVTESDFTHTTLNDQPVCHVSGESFRVFIRAYEKTMAAPLTFEGRKTTLNNYLDEMADMLKRTLTLGIPFNPLILR